MSNKNIYEVFDAFRKCKTKAERIDVLRKNDSYALRNVLYGTMNPNVLFLKEIPEFKSEEVPVGMSYTTMNEALHKAYLFQEGNPRKPAGLTPKRQQELLIQLLEGLEQKEADVYVGMLKKNLNIPYLTQVLVNEAFPDLFGKSQQAG